MSVAFRYRAATAQGEVIDGVVEAESSRAAIEALRRQTLIPVSVEAVARTAPPATPWAGLGRRHDALVTATRTIATMLAGGATVDRALRFAADHAGTPELGTALRGVRTDVQQGASLAQALRSRQALFGTLAPALVRAGEESGTLDEALERLADHVERVRDLRAQLQAALLYPALMGIVAGVGVLVLLAFVVPRFAAMLADAGASLPLSTRLLMAASALVMTRWWLWFPLGAAALLAGRAWLGDATNRRRWQGARLGWPVVGALERSIATARFARAFGTLLRGGTGVLPALRVAREALTNDALASRIDDAIRAVERGEPVARALEGTLPPLATQLLAVGEESGALDRMALRVADTYDAESQRALRGLVALVEPALIVGFGAVVGFVALAMLQAVYSINASVL